MFTNAMLSEHLLYKLFKKYNTLSVFRKIILPSIYQIVEIDKLITDLDYHSFKL